MRSTIMKALVSTTLLAVASAVPLWAGVVSLRWDPVPGAQGYHVYYGTKSGDYGAVPETSLTNAYDLSVGDCQTVYVAVKAYNALGESPKFSNEITGWAHPTVTSVTSDSGLNPMQGEQLVINVYGSNFPPDATVDLGRNIPVSAATVSCDHIQLLAAIEPSASGVHPAQVGKHDIVIVDADSVFGSLPKAVEVMVNPTRFDVNKTDSVTANRIDGKDLVYLSRQFGQSESMCRVGMPRAGAACVPDTEPVDHACGPTSVKSDCVANANYDPDKDFDGDGEVSGPDLALIGSVFGECWSDATKSWDLAACPAGQR